VPNALPLCINTREIRKTKMVKIFSHPHSVRASTVAQKALLVRVTSPALPWTFLTARIY